MAQLPHVVSTVSSFLDYDVPRFWTLVRASERNLLSLLPRLAVHEPVDMDPHYRAFNCSNMLVFAVANVNLEIVHWLREYYSSVYPRKTMAKAAQLGRVLILKWLVLRHADAIPIPAEIGAIALHGDIETQTWLDPFLRSNAKLIAVESAVQSGHIGAVKYLHERYFFLDRTWRSRNATSDTICGGHVEILKFLHTKLYPLDVFTAKFMAAQNGFLDIVEWLFPMLSFVGDQTPEIDAAADAGRLEVVQWLHMNGSRGFTSTAMVGAARNGHLEILQWLHETRSEGCTDRAMDNATRNGHLEVPEWLHEHRKEGFRRKPWTRLQSMDISRSFSGFMRCRKSWKAHLAPRLRWTPRP